MNLALRQPMSLAAFLDWEERQELRHEFDGFRPVAMTGGTAAHARIQRNLAISIGGRLRGGPCEFLGSDMKIVTAHTVRYPDGLVTCTPLANSSRIAAGPVVMFEVLSQSTASVDHTDKNQEYSSIPSVRRYVMLEQERIAATVFARGQDGWKGETLGRDAVLVLPEIGVELMLAELYEGLDLSGAEAVER
ncbi:MAG: Uma2 family endonuclease [Gluconacetobacter diazotrophicus]|nr:Uma2 family endonuclease [Gluconacetobacter diazotrophicus]